MSPSPLARPIFAPSQRRPATCTAFPANSVSASTEPGFGRTVSETRRPGWAVRLAASDRFQRFAADTPILRRFVRREGEALFDLVAGFCHSQVLMAFVRLELPQTLLAQSLTVTELAQKNEVPADRLLVLLKAAASLGLVRERRGLWRLTPRGAVLATVPGLRGMIDHHDVLYRDLEDPVAFFRGEGDRELARFWPYVFGAGAAEDPGQAATYSRLMAESQTLVAEETFASIDLTGVRRLADVGGGSGVFLAEAGKRYPDMNLTLVDLPAVVPAAKDRFERAGLSDRVTIVGKSFRDAPLPEGADAISIVRVLYDHADETVRDLLKSVHAALPVGGRLILSEPMTGGDRPQRAGDAYFALYCMAMETGRARSPAEHKALLEESGFDDVVIHPSRRPFITTVIEAVRKN